LRELRCRSAGYEMEGQILRNAVSEALNNLRRGNYGYDYVDRAGGRAGGATYGEEAEEGRLY
jgi:hypothetical protein